jgi:hypothetical protein
MPAYIDNVQPLINALARENNGLHSPTIRVYDSNTGEEFRIERVYTEDDIVCIDASKTGEITK